MAEEKKQEGTVKLVNNSAKVIHVLGVMLVPGMPAEVPAEAMQNEHVTMLMETPVEENSTVMALQEAPNDRSDESGVQKAGAAGSGGHAAEHQSGPSKSSETSAHAKPSTAPHPEVGGRSRQ
jgi:hypothetical protein